MGSKVVGLMKFEGPPEGLGIRGVRHGSDPEELTEYMDLGPLEGELKAG